MFNPNQREDYLNQIDRYKSLRPAYQALSEYLQKRLKEIAEKYDIYPIVMGRAKSVESFAEKIQRPGKTYQDPLKEMTDLCGVRVITHTLDQVDTLAKVLDAEFVLDPKNSEDKMAKLAFREFGYLSKHYIIQLKEPPRIDQFSQEKLNEMVTLKSELQLRTLAQHLWADIYHEMGYKNEFQLPSRWERQFARLAALLEYCDQGFQEIKNSMVTYESSYGNYMTEEDLRSLALRLEMLLDVDKDNIRVVQRLLKAYISLKDTGDKIRRTLKRYTEEELMTYPPALRDFGVTYCKVYPPGTEEFLKGQRLLKKAIERDPNDIDALCSLGGTYRREQEREEALECYRQAHRISPTNSFALGNYIAESLLKKKDVEIIHYFHSAIEAALDCCKKQIEVKINLPWAFFDLGIFHLYLGEIHESIAWYARGIMHTNHAAMISSAMKPIAAMVNIPIKLDGLQIIDKFLRLAYWTKASDEQRKKFGWYPSPASEIIKKIFKNPILILAGGCAGMETNFEAQLDLLSKGLEGFKGTIVSGGTRSGIAGMAGDLQQRADNTSVQTIGYVPSASTPGLKEQLDTRYSLSPRHTDGKDFSPLEPLTFWEAFLGSGGDPKKVKLIGFNGGNIASCEYRIALAFGAQVGIIQRSGRAAAELLADPQWKGIDSLRGLDLSGDDLKKFLAS